MATTAEKLKAAIDSWSMNPNDPKFGNWNVVINSSSAGAPLQFKRGQEVVDQMLGYNQQLGNVLSEEDLLSGLNKFSKSQYDHYKDGYAVDSDPFNIGRWAVAQSLIDKGSPDAGYKLIADTDARQAITSQQAIEIGKKAQEDYARMDAQMRDLAKVTGYGGGTTLGGYVQPDSGWEWLDDLVMTAAPLIVAGGFGAGLAGLGGVGGAAGLGAAEAATGLGALGEGAALGSGLTAGGGLGLTAGGGLGLTGTATGLGTIGAGGALTSAGLAGTGLGAGWAGLEAALGSGLSAGAGAAETLGSGISATGGSTGLTGTITGDLAGNLGALGSTTGGAGLTGTIPGLGTLTAEGVLLPAAGGAAGALGAAEGVATATGLETGFGPNGDLTLEQFLTSPDSVTGLEGFGGSQGIPAMDTLGSTSWLESAVNSLKHGDTSWLTSSVSPTQIKSVLSKALGGGSTPAKTGTAKAAAGAGGAGGINIFNAGGDDSGLADAMKIFSGGRSGMDSVVQAMSQSGKGN